MESAIVLPRQGVRARQLEARQRKLMHREGDMATSQEENPGIPTPSPVLWSLGYSIASRKHALPHFLPPKQHHLEPGEDVIPGNSSEGLSWEEPVSLPIEDGAALVTPYG